LPEEVEVPVRSPRKERPLIELFLTEYDNSAFKGCSIDWLEDKQDGAVEALATSPSGRTLAIEHTLIQPFVGEKFDSETFMKAFGRIEKNPALVLPERDLEIIIPVQAIPKGYNWDEVGEDLLTWLAANHAGAPKEGDSEYTVPVGSNSKNGPLLLRITLRTMSLPGRAGNCLISRHRIPGDLGTVVEKAVKTKIPKLVKTAADKRILLLERDQIGLGDSQVYQEVVELAPKFPDLAKIDEIWLANTSILTSEGWAYFNLIDARGLVERLSFENGVLKTRRDDRPHLGPPRREF
jgi:hypothetical protein